ncbi:MAG: CRISPR-associated RAMP protein [Chloroflexi bacterium]|nr:CRISPR-associated RAMP protein [Chloroflexota bacterium]
MFERFESRYELRGRVVTRAGLHVGVGGSLAVVGSDNPVARDARGLPFIPGSSFKGALRATIEALLRALSPGARQEPWACDPLDEAARCVTAEDVRDRDEAEVSALVARGVDAGGKACTACRLFGSPWLASRVRVCDLYLAQGEGWAGRIEVRDGVAIDRDTETVSGGRKYDYEVVPLETAFDLRLRADNVARAELGLLFVGLREFETGSAALGGHVSRGLGGVRLEGLEVEAVEGAEGLRAYLRDGRGRLWRAAELEDFQRACVEAFLATVGGAGHAGEAA